MKLRPIGDNILVRRLDLVGGAVASLYNPNELIVSSIELPSSWRAKSITGQVVAIGRGTLSALGHLIPNTVQVGDVVVFDHNAGSEIKINNETLLILKEENVLGVI